MISQALIGTLEIIADQKDRLDRLEADNRELLAKVDALSKSPAKPIVKARPSDRKTLET